ncbi:hypothetical protein Bbelb_075950 [Branchiostoma belcheri]|nr:hypothetical protein Bbelb_075950 [Branchiostoma belcheri]
MAVSGRRASSLALWLWWSVALVLWRGCPCQTEIGGHLSGSRVLTLAGSPYVAAEDIHVPSGSVLTVEPGVTVRFGPGVGLFVAGALKAQGRDDQRITFTRVDHGATWNLSSRLGLGIRLVGGRTLNEGRLELQDANDTWGTVCDDGWDSRDTAVACRQLGYRGGGEFRRFGTGTGPILLDEMDCDGSELALFKCRIETLGNHDCAVSSRRQPYGNTVHCAYINHLGVGRTYLRWWSWRVRDVWRTSFARVVEKSRNWPNGEMTYAKGVGPLEMCGRLCGPITLAYVVSPSGQYLLLPVASRSLVEAKFD